MTRRDWTQAERAFNRREPLEDDMGRGRWSMRSVGGEERHTIEFGFKYRFDIRAGAKSDGINPDVWWASSTSMKALALRFCVAWSTSAQRLAERLS
jgi:hypothetical protein